MTVTNGDIVQSAFFCVGFGFGSLFWFFAWVRGE